MKDIIEMKKYIIDNNLTHLVRELVDGLEISTNSAIEYVYDQHTMTKEEFIKKYF